MQERILKAAEELFLEQSLAKTTMTQIARKAGCNQALLHYYFRTKENLFEQIFEDKVRLLFAGVLEVESAGGLFMDKIRLMVGAHFDFLRQNPRLVPFVVNEVMFDRGRLESLIQKLHHYPESIFAKLVPQLQEQIRNGRIRPIEPMDLIITVVSLNVAPFLIMPLVAVASGADDAELDKVYEARKQENIETIMARLRL
jgi:AcrR family transcriptional regulator